MCTFRLKAAQQGFSLYCNDLWGVRHINLSGITPTKRNESGPNSVHVYKSRGDSVCEILGAISPVEAKCGARTNSTQPGFFLFSKPDDILETSQLPIFIKLAIGHNAYIHVPSNCIGKDFTNFSV